MKPQTALITHPNSLLHEMGAAHPESPHRIQAILAELHAQDLTEQMLELTAQTTRREDLIKVHAEDYVEMIIANAPQANNSKFFIDADTSMNQYSLNATLTAAGALLMATDGVMQNRFKRAFCCIRPPGHHAETNTAMGFCFFNNIALGAQYALDKYSLKRVAIVDFDVHHGNGTEDIFLNESGILFCSTFQEYIFPAKAGPSQSGHIVNVPLAAGCDSHMYREIFTEKILPELESFKPEIIFISAGFDAHKNDPLADINLEAADFAWITEQVLAVARQYAQGRVISTLEGGYDLKGLAQCASAHVRALL